MTDHPHILVVDDDEDILALLTDFFKKRGFTISAATGGKGLFAALADNPVDIVVLDIMLQGEDGLSLCRRLRMESAIPVIMLTAMGDATDRVVGLEIGADDYLTKPFDPRELLARIKAILRRSGAGGRAGPASVNRPIIAFDHWQLDISRRELRSADSALVMLSGAEFDLLLTFAEHSQRVLTREQLMDLARGPSREAYDRSIDVQVSRLRRKLEVDAKNPSIIKTVRNGGYIFTPKVVHK